MSDKSLQPSEKKTKSVAKKPTVTRRYQYTGPIPHPTILNAYDPQTRKVIVSMAQTQSAHRQKMESAIIESNIRNERSGMVVAALLTVFMIGSGVYLLMHDKDSVGFFLIFGPSVFQAGNYIYNRKKENEQQKQEKKESK